MRLKTATCCAKATLKSVLWFSKLLVHKGCLESQLSCSSSPLPGRTANVELPSLTITHPWQKPA